MKDYLIYKNKYFKNFANVLFKKMMEVRYGIKSNISGFDFTDDDVDWMRFQLVKYQENEDNEALTTTAIRYRSWLAVDYNHLTPHHSQSAGSRYSRCANNISNIGMSYNYGPGESQNLIEINAGGCLTRINLNPAITINNSAKYEHTQSIAASTWIITHNLGFTPNVFSIDLLGQEIEGVVDPIDNNSLQIIFSEPVAGIAYLS